MTYQCPECDSRNLEVDVRVRVALLQDSHGNIELVDADVDDNYHWSENSLMFCMDCQYQGILDDFAIEVTSYQVAVGNIGTVYSGPDEAEARRKYDAYVEQSKSGVGRAGDESVTLMCDGEPIMEHEGKAEAC